VFAAALAAGVTAGLHMPQGERPRVDPNRRQELWFGALGVEAAAPRLAVASVLAAEQPVLELVPKTVVRPLLPARAGLLAWEAVSQKEPSVVEAAKAALAEQLTAAPQGSPGRASAVLLLAELEAVVAPSERSHAALAQIGSQLIGEALRPIWRCARCSTPPACSSGWVAPPTRSGS
jgi:hypothetical protein